MDQKTTQKRMAALFNEWAERYATDPSSFTSVLDAEGKAVEDYGESCARFFTQLAKEMDKAGALPTALPPSNAYLVDLDDPEVRGILGRPCFRCIAIASILRHGGGLDIPHKAEQEQAAVIAWLLQKRALLGDGWRVSANFELNAMSVKARRAREAQEAQEGKL